MSLPLIDRIGRKILLIFGFTIQGITLIIMAALLLDNQNHSGWIIVGCCLLYIAAFAIGPGAVVWSVISEICTTER